MNFRSDIPDSEQDAIVVWTGCCHRAIYLAVNLPEVMDPYAMKEIGECVKQGCTVEHMSVESARKVPFGCTCGKKL